MDDSRFEEIFDYLAKLSMRLQVLEESVFLSSKNNFSGTDEMYRLNQSNGVVNVLEDETGKDENCLVAMNQTKCSKIENYVNKSVKKHFLNKVDTTQFRESTLFPTLTVFKGNNQNRLDLILWLIIHTLSFTVSFIYIKDAYDNWQYSPVVQAVSNKLIHIDNIPFPAVTICWPNNLNQDYDLIYNFDKCLDCEENSPKNICHLKNVSCTYQEKIMLVYAGNLCGKYFAENPLPSDFYQDFPHAMDGIEFHTYMENLLPECESDVVLTRKPRASRKGYTRCDGQVFQQFLTSNSKQLCMTYNGLPHEDIFEENVVTPILLERRSPNMTSNANVSWSLDTMIDFKGGLETVPIYGMNEMYISIQKQDKRYSNICNFLQKDIASVIIHSPNDIPLDYDNAVEHVISENTLLDLFIEPKITLTRDNLVEYSPQQRGCFYLDERKLTMFKFYSKMNCELECIVYRFLEVCGCVPYNYPRPNSTVQVCIQPCRRPTYRCDCLPNCNSLSFDVQTQEAPIQASKAFNFTSRALVEVIFNAKEYYTTIRYSITSFGDFLAYSLGVLGVFNGFSVILLWELVYWVTIGLWTSVKTSLRQSMNIA